VQRIAALFDAHQAALHRYLVRLCGDADLAADAAQEAFVRAVEQPASRPIARAWLYTVATNVVRERERTAARRRRLVAVEDARLPMADPPPDPHALLEARERDAVVRAALAELSDKERAALLMREEGFTHREIALALGTTTGSIGTLVARALDRLARTLHPLPDDS
jgi:RNA polymerase sigma factor (sigma-70 family)